MKTLFRKIFTCWLFGLHDWTSKAAEGIPPNKEDVGELAFWEYAKMYCKCCGKVSPLSQKEIDRVKREHMNKKKAIIDKCKEEYRKVIEEKRNQCSD